MDPFKFGQVVSGEDFCPRPDLTKRVRDYIKQVPMLEIPGEVMPDQEKIVRKYEDSR